MDCYSSRKPGSAAERCETLRLLDSRVSGYLENHWQQLKEREKIYAQKKKKKRIARSQPWDQHGSAFTTPGSSLTEVLAGPLVLDFFLLLLLS